MASNPDSLVSAAVTSDRFDWSDWLGLAVFMMPVLVSATLAIIGSM